MTTENHHFAFRSWTLKLIAGMMMTVGAVGAHSSGAAATRNSDRAVEFQDCRGDRENGGHDDRGHDNRPPRAGSGLQQTISVLMRATVFLRVDRSGRVTAAATNTGCQPSKNDEFFLFRPNGAIERTTMIGADACDWTGDFTVPGRFQPQACRAHRHGRGTDDSHHRHVD